VRDPGLHPYKPIVPTRIILSQLDHRLFMENRMIIITQKLDCSYIRRKTGSSSSSSSSSGGGGGFNDASAPEAIRSFASALCP
jgi:uncharacterized membrane protein